MSKYLPQSISELKEATLKKILVILFLLTTFGLLAIAVTTLPLTTYWDSIILKKVHNLQSLELDQIAIALTQTAGAVAILAITSLLSIGLVWWKQWRSLGYIWLVIIGGGLITFLAKLLFHRARPDVWVSPLPQPDFSFPSGHSMLSMSLVMAIAMLIPHKHWRLIWLFTGGFWFMAIAWTRLYLGVHYPSDILGGWLLAIFWAIAGSYLTKVNAKL
ncbi:phosphatase PAP2 family protein [Pseudanabaena sp. FACHB-1998]|uniref:phosphatase PAP2 family protein n=1 Tax=Pseudanabaena sp. FACHB-1998 TaxID=2692858 RepID=UPI00168151B4|nr:phosphatase PAP2 family protein [Pseudanabaena sp. FACHB-1998]MBD2177500.1 phosphatase PAP2 family protein [Pseudanabaena sp. FACHB-1998]